MQFPWQIILLIVCCPTRVKGATGGIPTCANSCVSRGQQMTLCSPSNTTCICADTEYQADVSTCVMMRCPLKDTLSMRNLTSVMCEEPIRDRSRITPLVTTIFGIFAIVATLLRCLQFRTHFDVEDICAISGLLAAVPMGALEYPMSDDGFGKDIWTVPFENVTRIVKYTWITQLLYIASLSCVKMAFLFLCRHIFPNKGLRKVIYILMGFVLAYLIVYLVGLGLECFPISYLWTQWTGETTGYCLNINAFGWSCAIWNIVLDLAIMAVPLYGVRKLSLRSKKKILIMVMFGAGFFVTIVSIVRLKAIIAFASTTNPTYDNVPTAYWSVVECYSAIVCLNMPAIRRFWKSCMSMCSFHPSTEPSDGSPAIPIQSESKRHSVSGVVGRMIGANGNQQHSDVEYIELLHTRTREKTADSL